MSLARAVSIGLLFAGTVAGTIADRPERLEPLVLGGYRVLAADFHIHSSTWSDGALTPWGLVLEAERQGLDVIAITGHNQVSDAKVGGWFAGLIGSPVVITGQEVVAPGHHVIAVGIEQVVDSRQNVGEQIQAIHQQGGVAIAAHPLPQFWPGFDAAAMARLDGAEICHPMVYGKDANQLALERFAARGHLAAIGSSDFHGLGRMGMCRTYLFAADTSRGAILDAVRARRTVVYGEKGRAYGDPSLVHLAESYPALRERAVHDPAPTTLERISRLAGLLGLAGLVLTQSRSSVLG
jgi:predicted metal-dependent phosphoesterase TrpH